MGMKDILPLIIVAGAVYFYMKSQGSSATTPSGAATSTSQGVLPGDPRIAAGTLPSGTPVLSPYSGLITFGNQVINSGCAAGYRCNASGILTGLSGVWSV